MGSRVVAGKGMEVGGILRNRGQIALTMFPRVAQEVFSMAFLN